MGTRASRGGEGVAVMGEHGFQAVSRSFGHDSAGTLSLEVHCNWMKRSAGEGELCIGPCEVAVVAPA